MPQITLSLILPVYNERKTIESVLKEWSVKLTSLKINYVFIVCEDGSNDGTGEFLQKIQRKYRLILNQKNKRRGYGQAVIDGINAADSPYILCIDSDGQCNPNDFPKFWQKRSPDKILIGWRKKRADPNSRIFMSALFYLLFKFLFSTNIHDPSCPFVLFNKKLLFSDVNYLTYLQEGFWWGFVGWCVKKKLILKEIPVNHRERIEGKSQVYKPLKIPEIAIRNAFGLIKLRTAKVKL